MPIVVARGESRESLAYTHTGTSQVVAIIERAYLGLPDLDINDHKNFILSGNTMLGGSTTFRRQTVKSPYVEGEITVNRVKEMVEHQVYVDVISSDGLQTTIAKNRDVVIDAFQQDFFQMTILLDDAYYIWQCEASDMVEQWTIERLHSQRFQLQFNVRCFPTLLSHQINPRVTEPVG